MPFSDSLTQGHHQGLDKASSACPNSSPDSLSSIHGKPEKLIPGKKHSG